jgi:mRNA-degrading endonuclease RelE of RelBE toxin-antitoxin system
MKIPCTVKFTRLADDDLDKLSDSLYDECMNMIDKLEKNIHLGKPLEDKNGKNLSDCYKIYFNNAKYRIVYRKLNECYQIVGISESPKAISEIIAIGKRDAEQVYIDATKRLGR